MSDKQQKKDETKTTTTKIVNHFLFPAVTDDYRVTKGKFGYQLVANRRIPKGSVVMTNSLEFLFSDVEDGDCLWLANHEVSSKLPCGSGGGGDGDDGENGIVPEYIPVTRHMLMATHGLHQIQKQSSDEVVLSMYLEVPGMMMNHSCDPSMIENDGEDIAARNLEVGDELTVDYAGGDFDFTPVKDCSCGAANCRGKAIAFNHMNKSDQERLFPKLMPATRAQYLSALGKGPRVRDEEIVHPPRTPPMPGTAGSTNRKVMRLVCPGPCAEETKVMIKKCINDENFDARVDSIHEYGLYATEDFSKGQMLYYFWSQNWPLLAGEEAVIDMAFATPEQDEGDDKEGIVIRFDSQTCGAYRNVNGQLTFSAWQLLSAHSCDPNTVYRNKEKFEGDNWQRVVAAKDIKKGDRLSVDWNCFICDLHRDSAVTCSLDAVCHCGVPTCTGTKQGFKHLASNDQQERLEMTWLHEAPSASSDNGSSMLSRALSPFVREAWKNVGGPEDQKQECLQHKRDTSSEAEGVGIKKNSLAATWGTGRSR